MAPDPNASKSSLLNRLIGSAAPAVSKVKNVNPAAAKTSAAKGVTGTKELLGLSLAYVKQETKEPLAGIGRLLKFGIAGAVLMGFGLVLLGLSLLRGLQGAFAYVHADGGRGPLSGTLSWLPYLLTVVACVVVVVTIVVLFMQATKKQTRNGVSQ